MASAMRLDMDLARYLLSAEGADYDRAQTVVEASQRVCEKLSERAALIFTTAGSRALMRRALYLTRRDHPFLLDVSSEECLEGLDMAVAGLAPDEASKAVATIFANFIALLGTFIGDDLTTRSLADVWPGALADRPKEAQ